MFGRKQVPPPTPPPPVDTGSSSIPPSLAHHHPPPSKRTLDIVWLAGAAGSAHQLKSELIKKPERINEKAKDGWVVYFFYFFIIFSELSLIKTFTCIHYRHNSPDASMQKRND